LVRYEETPTRDGAVSGCAAFVFEDFLCGFGGMLFGDLR
jgi:hypothetical protein